MAGLSNDEWCLIHNLRVGKDRLKQDIANPSIVHPSIQ